MEVITAKDSSQAMQNSTTPMTQPLAVVGVVGQ